MSLEQSCKILKSPCSKNISFYQHSFAFLFSAQVTEQTYEILKDKGFKFIYRGPVKVKGKGQLVTYYLTGRDEKQKPLQLTKYGVVM